MNTLAQDSRDSLKQPHSLNICWYPGQVEFKILLPTWTFFSFIDYAKTFMWIFISVSLSRSRLPAFQTRKLGLFYLLCVKVRPLDNVSVEVEGVTSKMSEVNVSDNKHTEAESRAAQLLRSWTLDTGQACMTVPLSTVLDIYNSGSKTSTRVWMICPLAVAEKEQYKMIFIRTKYSAAIVS